MGAVTIELGDTDQLSLTVSMSEYLSVMALLWEAVSGKTRGVPTAVRAAIAAEVPRSGHAAMMPMSDPARSMVPGCLLPIDPAIDSDVAGSVDRLHAMPVDSIEAAIVEEFGETPPPVWQGPARSPRPWLDAFAGSVARTAEVTGSLLRGAAPLLEREIARVGSLLVRGGPMAVLDNLTPRITAADGAITFDDVEPETIALAGRQIVLLPIVAGHQLLISTLDQPDRIWISYPVPDAGQLWSRRPTGPTSDNLAALLGTPRAALLRALRTPAPMSELADLAHCSASTATFHVGRLERAGLVQRSRHGQQVHVSMTERGRQLFDVMQ